MRFEFIGIKWSELKFLFGIIAIKKRQRFIEYTGTKRQVFLTFITNHGVVKNAYANEVMDVEVVLEELVL